MFNTPSPGSALAAMTIASQISPTDPRIQPFIKQVRDEVFEQRVTALMANGTSESVARQEVASSMPNNDKSPYVQRAIMKYYQSLAGQQTTPKISINQPQTPDQSAWNTALYAAYYSANMAQQQQQAFPFVQPASAMGLVYPVNPAVTQQQQQLPYQPLLLQQQQQQQQQQKLPQQNFGQADNRSGSSALQKLLQGISTAAAARAAPPFSSPSPPSAQQTSSLDQSADELQRQRKAAVTSAAVADTLAQARENLSRSKLTRFDSARASESSNLHALEKAIKQWTYVVRRAHSTTPDGLVRANWHSLVEQYVTECTLQAKTQFSQSGGVVPTWLTENWVPDVQDVLSGNKPPVQSAPPGEGTASEGTPNTPGVKVSILPPVPPVPPPPPPPSEQRSNRSPPSVSIKGQEPSLSPVSSSDGGRRLRRSGSGSSMSTSNHGDRDSSSTSSMSAEPPVPIRQRKALQLSSMYGGSHKRARSAPDNPLLFQGSHTAAPSVSATRLTKKARLDSGFSSGLEPTTSPMSVDGLVRGSSSSSLSSKKRNSRPPQQLSLHEERKRAARMQRFGLVDLPPSSQQHPQSGQSLAGDTSVYKIETEGEGGSLLGYNTCPLLSPDGLSLMTYEEQLSMLRNVKKVVGKSRQLEKVYLRLCGPPDPALVRSESVLADSLEYCLKKYEQSNSYLYIDEQFRSIRQDLMVQKIRNELTVKVYETNAIIALQNNDLGQFNQCQTQLRELHKRLHSKRRIEFLCYRILYLGLMSMKFDYLKAMKELKQDRKYPPVQFAISFCRALNEQNYNRIFKFACDTLASSSSSDKKGSAPFLSSTLISIFLPRLRMSYLLLIAKSHYQVTIPFLQAELRFTSREDCLFFLTKNNAVFVNNCVDCRKSVAAFEASPLLQTKKIKALG